MEKDKIYQKLKYLFNDKSMPSMVLLNGKWGSGKSYYLSKTLIPYLESQKQQVVSFSLYGVASIEDFRDKLISTYLLKNKNTTGILDKLTHSIIGATGFTSAENSSSLLTIFNGLKGVAKHSILTKLEKFILVLDDLERVENVHLINDILGECLQLSENNNVEVLVLANAQSISGFSKTIDKCMSDTIDFSLSFETILNICFGSQQSKAVQACFPKILETIQKLDITNLRILKRCASRVDGLISYIESTMPEIDAELSANFLIPQVITIINAHYQHEMSCEVIKHNISHRISSLAMRISEEELTPEDQKIRGALALAAYSTDDIIAYACGEKFSAEEISDFGKLPLKSSLLDKLILGGPSYLSESEMTIAYNELEEYLNSEEEIDCLRWFSCLDSLDHLITNKYVSLPLFIGNSTIDFGKRRSECIKFSKTALSHTRLTRLLNSEIEAVMKNTFIKSREESSRIVLNDFKTSMLSSWSSVDMDAYTKYNKESFINVVGSNFIINCIDNWTHTDIALFKNFTEERYGFQNIGDYFLDELNEIKNLNKCLSKRTSTSKPSLKTGAIFELNKQLKDVEKRLIAQNREA